MYIADLHIHSRYSRATSRDCTPEHLDLWARRKGIHLVGTGDFTHRAWREELGEKLEPAEEGLYRLKKEYRISDDTVRTSWEPRFVVSGEISSIYKKYDRTRKVHSLILLPGLEAAALISAKLETIGNIHSDGRPILGLNCHDLLELVLELCPQAIYVPAHIWTPHFSLFGAFSGFDTVEECFEDLSPHIHALETGLSSDPPMNWRVSALDRFQLISNSDAHSPAKLGREANLLDIRLSYEGLYQAVQSGKGLEGTIEFFPEEGKYHYDGHRKCGICLSPVEADQHKGICPVCGRKMTTGVSHRIEQLSDRPEGFLRKEAKRYESLVPLPEVIGSSIGKTAASVRTQREYETMLRRLGPEFEILREISIEDIQKVSGTRIAEGIWRLRQGKVERRPGFDGEYGKISLFLQDELENPDGQLSFLDSLQLLEDKKQEGPGASKIDQGTRQDLVQTEEKKKEKKEEARRSGKEGFWENQEQQEAVKALERVLAVKAGPGTGKTWTLISHILYLVQECGVKTSEITAVTFTNQAAKQLRERLEEQMGSKRGLKKLQTGTFHALCLAYLQERGETGILLDETESLELLREVAKEAGLKRKPERLQSLISLYKTADEGEQPKLEEKEMEAMQVYNSRLRDHGLWDYDDLLTKTCRMLEEEGADRKAFRYLLVDEFQDINPIQYKLLKLWNQGGAQLFVIGDPDQSIYGFRGSSGAYFERLRADFSKVREITLVWNYRSTPEILNAALPVISRNPGPERALRPQCPRGDRVRLVTAESSWEEAVFIAKEIVRQVGGVDMLQAHKATEQNGGDQNRSFGDIAVLYRTHRQAELIEHCLRQEGIPYIIGGRDSFLSEPAVRGTLSFFRFLLKGEDTYSENICRRLFGGTEEEFSEMVEKYSSLVHKGKPERILKQWAEERKLKEDVSIGKLTDMACLAGTMEEFLNRVLLGVESDLWRCPGRHYTADAVRLMTLHGAKGLEFPVVLLCGVKKGLLPLDLGQRSGDLMEERRLFYVGMTRAREELVLLTSQEPSIFLDEIPEDCICKEEALVKKQEDSGIQLSLFDWIR